MVGTSRFGYLHLRRFRRHRHRRRHPGPAHRADHGFVPGRYLCGRGDGHSALPGQVFPLAEPLVAGAWMGLAVKSDGGAIASGAITDALIRAQALDMEGINYAEGWITMTATTVKMFIDIFIGVWAFMLAYIWCAKIDVKPGQKVDAAEIWHRFPKFVIGYVLTFVILVVMCWPSAKVMGPAEKELAELKASVTSIETKMKATTDATALAGLKTELERAKNKQKAVNETTKEPKKLPEQGKICQQSGRRFPGAVLPPLLLHHRSGIEFQETDGRGASANWRRSTASACSALSSGSALFISWLFFHGVKPPIISNKEILTWNRTTENG